MTSPGEFWIRAKLGPQSLRRRSPDAPSQTIPRATPFRVKRQIAPTIALLGTVLWMAGHGPLTAWADDIREDIARLQIFLDQSGFGPGKIDGRPGEFTDKALARYALAHGLTADSTILDQLGLDPASPISTTCTITENDLQWIGVVPEELADKARLKRIPYETLLEFLDERFHCDPDFLRHLNKGRNLEKLKPGDTVSVPNVEPFRIEELKEVTRLPAKPKLGNRHVRISTKEKMLDLYDGEKLVASFPITPGSSKLPAPPGEWKIVGVAILPWFRHDEAMLKHGVRSDDYHNLPPGPNNPVGVVWAALNKTGIGIHGTDSPQTIGRSASHGCIRLANWDAIRFADMVTQGTPVIIAE